MDGGGDNLWGEQRRAHGEPAAEVLLSAGLERLGLSEEEVLSRKSPDPEKQALAWLPAKHTAVTCPWVVGRPAMGHRSNASRAIRRVEAATDRQARRRKKEMLQCTG